MTSNTDETRNALSTFYQTRNDKEHQFEVKDFMPLQGGADHIMYTFNLIDGQVIQPSVLRLYKWPGAAEFEYKVMETLGHNNIPVPKVFILENDANYLGFPFMIMEKIKGNSLGNVIVSQIANEPEWITSSESTNLCNQFAGLLASIHGLDYQGLRIDFLNPSKWSIETIVPSFSTPAVLEQSARSEEYKKLIEWCLARIPKSVNPERVILHGDYHPNNVMVCGDKLLGVIDWTDTCLGEAGIDVAWANCILYLAGAEEIINPFVSEYKRRSGRKLADLALHEVIAGFRILVNLASIISSGGMKDDIRSDSVVNLDIKKYINKVFSFIYWKTRIDISNIVNFRTRAA